MSCELPDVGEGNELRSSARALEPSLRAKPHDSILTEKTHLFLHFDGMISF